MLSPEECRNVIAHNRLAIKYMDQAIDLPVNPVGETVHIYWLHGHLDDHGWCSSRSFIDGGILYEDAMLEVTLKFTRQRLQSLIMDDANGTPQLVLDAAGDAILANYGEGHLTDRAVGTAVWEVENTSAKNCSNNLYSAVFHNFARLHQLRPEFRSPTSNSFLLHDEQTTMSEGTTTASALILQNKIEGGLQDCQLDHHLQGMELYQTHIRDILVAYRVRKPPEDDEYFVPLELDVTNLQPGAGNTPELIKYVLCRTAADNCESPSVYYYTVSRTFEFSLQSSFQLSLTVLVRYRPRVRI